MDAPAPDLRFVAGFPNDRIPPVVQIDRAYHMPVSLLLHLSLQDRPKAEEPVLAVLATIRIDQDKFQQCLQWTVAHGAPDNERRTSATFQCHKTVPESEF